MKVGNKEQKINKDELKKRISSCGFFVVLSTKNYLELLKMTGVDNKLST